MFIRKGADPLDLTEPQEEAVYRGCEHFKQNERGLLVGACGIGKTLIGCRIASGFRPQAKRILITVPTRLLVKQAIEDWRRNYDPAIEVQFVAVCSDQGVRGDLSNEELEEAGIPVTTDAESLRHHLAKRLPDGFVLVVVSTYNSLPVVGEAQGRQKSLQFDFAIGDEAHHTAGRAAVQGALARSFQLLLDGRSIRAARLLFMTATPRVIAPPQRRSRPSPSLDSFGVDEKDLFSMDDAQVYGRIFYELTLAQAIEEPEVPVVPYRIIPHLVRRSDLDFVRDEENGLPYAGMSEEEACAVYVLEDLMDRMPELGATHVITYHDRKEKASEFRNVLRALNGAREGKAPFNATYLDGTMSMTARSQAIQQFTAPHSAHSVLSNCKALTEGVNVREAGVRGLQARGANALMFADPKGSVVEVMQAIGRIIRASEDEDKVGTVIVPMVVDDRRPENPVVTEASVMRLRRILFAAKLVDAKLSTRLVVPEEPAHPHALNPCGAPSPESVSIARRAHVERGWLSVVAVRDVIEQAQLDVRSLSGRDYFGTRWNDLTGYWEAEVENPWYDDYTRHPDPTRWGSSRRIVLGREFADSEEAALAVDEFIREAKLTWQTNFGHNPHRPEEDVRENITSRFPGKISYAPSRHKSSRWRAYLDMMVPDGQGGMTKAKPNAYFESEELAIGAHDAICRRYGRDERLVEPQSPPRYDLILNPRNRVEEGVEEEMHWKHVPGKQFWAYVQDAQGRVHEVGYFSSLEEARASRLRRLAELATPQSAPPPPRRVAGAR